jgi:broad specificity phosphatase PhoE
MMKVQWRALDEINAGVCDGMTYLEIKETMPEDYQYAKILEINQHTYKFAIVL